MRVISRPNKLTDPLSGARRGEAAVAHYDALLRDERFASAMAPDLVLRDRDPNAESAALAAVATWATQFTPAVTLAPPDAVSRMLHWLDILRRHELDEHELVEQSFAARL